jgi:hypothetical protein
MQASKGPKKSKSTDPTKIQLPKKPVNITKDAPLTTDNRENDVFMSLAERINQKMNLKAPLNTTTGAELLTKNSSISRPSNFETDPHSSQKIADRMSSTPSVQKEEHHKPNKNEGSLVKKPIARKPKQLHSSTNSSEVSTAPVVHAVTEKRSTRSRRPIKYTFDSGTNEQEQDSSDFESKSVDDSASDYHEGEDDDDDDDFEDDDF